MSNDTQDTTNRLQAHFWITATTLGLHAFLMSALVEKQNKTIILCVAIGVWVLAVHQLIEIAAANKADVPSKPIKGYDKKPYTRKFCETLENLRLIYKRFWFVLMELKGAFFCVALVSCSLWGAIAVNGFARPTILVVICVVGILILSWILDRLLHVLKVFC